MNQQNDTGQPCTHCDGTGIEPIETSEYPPEPCSVCKVPVTSQHPDPRERADIADGLVDNDGNVISSVAAHPTVNRESDEGAVTCSTEAAPRSQPTASVLERTKYTEAEVVKASAFAANADNYVIVEGQGDCLRVDKLLEFVDDARKLERIQFDSVLARGIKCGELLREAELEIERLKKPMACGHPKACWVEHVHHRMCYAEPDPSYGTVCNEVGHCSVCEAVALERAAAVSQAAEHYLSYPYQKAPAIVAQKCSCGVEFFGDKQAKWQEHIRALAPQDLLAKELARVRLETLSQAQMVAQDYELLTNDELEAKYGTGHCPIAIAQLREQGSINP